MSNLESFLSLSNSQNHLSPLLTAYLGVSFLLSFIPFFIYFFHFSRLLDLEPLSIFIIILVISVFVWFLVYIILTGKGGYEAYTLSVTNNEVSGPTVKPVNLLLLLLPSSFLIYFYWFNVYTYASNAGSLSTLSVVLFIMGGTPSLYLISGVLYQTFSFVKRVRYLFKNSEYHVYKYDQSHDYSLRVIDSNSFEANSLDMGFRKFIFISSSYFSEFGNRVQAIVHHEEAHLEHSDSLLSFLVPILCIFTVAPQGVVYEALNFHVREARADATAAKVDPKLLKSILIDLRDVEYSERVNNLSPSASSPFLSRSSTNRIVMYFSLFYRAHGVYDSHLTLTERIERLQELERR